MKQNYLIVIEKGAKNYSAYSPDVTGCVSTGKTVEETLKNMKEALEFHFEGMFEDGEEIPISKGLSYHLAHSGEISSDDIITHLDIEITHPAFA